MKWWHRLPVTLTFSLVKGVDIVLGIMLRIISFSKIYIDWFLEREKKGERENVDLLLC